MFISEYRYIKGTEQREGLIAIPELDRKASSVKQFIELADLDIVLTKPTAFIYLDGFTISQSESGLCNPKEPIKRPVLKTGSSYIAHEWVYTFENKEFLVAVDLISSTCAGGIQALREAQRHLYSGLVEEVIIIGGERITEDTIRLFKELRIPVVCGDGFVYMKLKAGKGISDVKWKYAYEQNPFFFSRKTMDRLIPSYRVDFVKLHGTGTSSNRDAEAGLAQLGIPIIYKNSIGHTQGISSLLETCIALDDKRLHGKILVTANGVGGFYGSFLLEK